MKTKKNLKTKEAADRMEEAQKKSQSMETPEAIELALDTLTKALKDTPYI